MRDAYHEELERINDQLVEMTRLVGSAMARASTALLDADLSLAESVIAADDAIDVLRDELDRRAFDLLARQQPVANDLRAIVTSPDLLPFFPTRLNYRIPSGDKGLWQRTKKTYVTSRHIRRGRSSPCRKLGKSFRRRSCRSRQA